MITEREFLERARLDRRTLTVWIEEEWLIPARTLTSSPLPTWIWRAPT